MPVSFKLDENLPASAVTALRGAGFDTSSVLLQGLGGSKDPHVAAVCREERRILVTLDLDFADIRTYPPGSGPGVVILRPARQSIQDILDLIAVFVDAITREPVDGALWIVERERIRVRSTPPH
jgi:predicted nuclease of predicted toxin-antitoxin system